MASSPGLAGFNDHEHSPIRLLTSFMPAILSRYGGAGEAGGTQKKSGGGLRAHRPTQIKLDYPARQSRVGFITH
jgi:hypothetical protein